MMPLTVSMTEHCKTISHPWVRTPPYYPVEGAEKIGPSGHYPFKRPVNLKVSHKLSSLSCLLFHFFIDTIIWVTQQYTSILQSII